MVNYLGLILIDYAKLTMLFMITAKNFSYKESEATYQKKLPPTNYVDFRQHEQLLDFITCKY